LDETHHKKSSQENKGGNGSGTLTNPDLPRAGTRYAKDSRNHVTGCYGSTPLETIPPVLIYTTVLLEEELTKAIAELAENTKKDQANVARDDFRLDEQSDADGSDSEVEYIAEETGI